MRAEQLQQRRERDAAREYGVSIRVELELAGDNQGNYTCRTCACISHCR